MSANTARTKTMREKGKRLGRFAVQVIRVTCNYADNIFEISKLFSVSHSTESQNRVMLITRRTCPACAAGERLMCEKVADVHKSAKKTKDPLLSFNDISCQMCDDKHAATHWCVYCDPDEQFICLERAEIHK